MLRHLLRVGVSAAPLSVNVGHHHRDARQAFPTSAVFGNLRGRCARESWCQVFQFIQAGAAPL